MAIRIALAGNPNCGKTTMFNALTGANQYVGNWPGVTVEKKEGKLKSKKVKEEVVVTDLPGIYSLSPYTLEEVVSRDYLLKGNPDVIVDLVDATNIERNLYLTTQLIETGVPVVIALNMADLLEKRGIKIDVARLSMLLDCPIVETSALKGEGLDKLIDEAIKTAKKKEADLPKEIFNKDLEDAVSAAAEVLPSSIDANKKRWYAVKFLEKDSKVAESVKLTDSAAKKIEELRAGLEKSHDDDMESIVTDERYKFIQKIVGTTVKKGKDKLTTSDKIDKIVTNRILALPIFIVVMWLVYYIAMSTVGAWCTDWTNDNLFGDGFHLFGIGSKDYKEASGDYDAASNALDAYGVLVTDDEDAVDVDATKAAIEANTNTEASVKYQMEDEETLDTYDIDVYYSEVPAGAKKDKTNAMSYLDAVEYFNKTEMAEIDPADYGVFVPSIPDLAERGLDKIGCADWLKGLILDGIIAGVGAVLGFVPQMLVLFILLAILEYCGYMARIAFIMDRIFRKFGLSGKSFIPILVGVGCGVPGIMASRTIENEKDRRMTVMTTTFIPCGAKVPFIAMIAGAIFGGSSLVATSAYFIGIAAIICSGIILKKTKMFAGDPAPFVMELPPYHIPTIGSVLRSMWERGWSFIKKAGTIILLSTILVWFTTYFGILDGKFQMLSEDQIDHSILAKIGGAICWIFKPQGWGDWQATVASITGLVAKENIVGTMGILYGGGEGTVYSELAKAFTTASGFSFLVFNLLCAPCFAAMGAIKREMNSAKWFWFAIGYQCGFAYLVSLVVYRIAGLFTGACSFGIGTVVAILIIVAFFFLLFRPDPNKKVKTSKEFLNA